jgi:hypothetical protein
MTLVKNKKNTKIANASDNIEKKELMHFWLESKLVQPYGKQDRWFSTN